MEEVSEEPEYRQAIEEWATRKGMLPTSIKNGEGPPHPNPNHWRFAGARALRGWVDRQLVSEEDFDAAVEEAARQQVR